MVTFHSLELFQWLRVKNNATKGKAADYVVCFLFFFRCYPHYKAMCDTFVIITPYF